MKYWRTADRRNVDTFLVHHGIDGQKWGVKHGPPYPLDDSTSTGKKLVKRESKRVVQGEAYKEKRKAKYQKQIDKLEKKINKNPEKENSKKNIKRKYYIERLTNRMNDLDKMSNDTLLYLKDAEYAQRYAMIWNLLGMSAAVPLAAKEIYNIKHSDSDSIKSVLGTLNEEQKKAVMNLIYIVLKNAE